MAKNIDLKPESPLVVHGLFSRQAKLVAKPQNKQVAKQELSIEPTYHKLPELNPEPISTPGMEMDRIGGMAESLGTLSTNFAAGNFSDIGNIPSTNEFSIGAQMNPAALFSRNQFIPNPAIQQKNLDKEMEKKKLEDELYRKKSHSRK